MNTLRVIACFYTIIVSLGFPFSERSYLIHQAAQNSGIQTEERQPVEGQSIVGSTQVSKKPVIGAASVLPISQKLLVTRAFPVEQTQTQPETSEVSLDSPASKSNSTPFLPPRRFFSTLLTHLNAGAPPGRTLLKGVQARSTPPRKSPVYVHDYYAASRLIKQIKRMHHIMGEYFENSNFLKFAEDYTDLRLFFSRISAHVSEMEKTGNLYLEQVMQRYKMMFIMFRLFEIQCGWILKGGSLRSSLNCYDDSPGGHYLRQDPGINEVCTKVMEIEGHLQHLFAADQGFKFEIEDPRSASVQDLDEDFSDAEIARIENAFGKFSDFERSECFQADGPEATAFGEQKKRVLRQYMNLQYMLKRLHFVRKRLIECERSAFLGFQSFLPLKMDMLAICTEVEVQLAAMRLPDDRSKKLIEYLLQITIYRIKEVERKLKYSNESDEEEDYETQGGRRAGHGKCHMREAEGIEMELRSTLSNLKKIHKRGLVLGAQGIEGTLSKLWTRWSEFSAYINERHWCWTAQEGLVIQFKEAEVADLLLVLQSFADKAVSCRTQNVSDVKRDAFSWKVGLQVEHENGLVELIRREYPALKTYLDRLLRRGQ